MKSDLKTLHIGKYFPPFKGGIEKYFHDLIVALSKRGVGCSAVVHKSTPSFRTSYQKLTVDSDAVEIAHAATWAQILYTPISPGFFLTLNGMIKRTQPDVLHLHMPNVSTFWCLVLPRALKLPWVIHWHADVVASKFDTRLKYFYFLYKPFETLVIKRSRAIICTSPPYKNSSEPLQPFIGKCHVVPLGLDPGLQECRDKENLPRSRENGTLRVLSIGRLTYYKGFQYLIEAAVDTAGIEIHIVGTGGEASALLSLADQLNVTDKVVFRGSLSDSELAAELERCDCVCLPSIERTEAFGLVLLEAMSHGKPCVVSDVPGSGMSWVIADGVTGIKVKPGDAKGLRAALESLRDDAAKTVELGRNARKEFDNRFDIELSASAVERIYLDVLQQHERSSHGRAG